MWVNSGKMGKVIRSSSRDDDQQSYVSFNRENVGIAYVVVVAAAVVVRLFANWSMQQHSFFQIQYFRIV